VVYGGEGVVEVVEEMLPLPVLRRGAEAYGVVFEGLPVHEQKVAVGVFDAGQELVGEVALHAGDERRSLPECLLERGLLVGANVQDGYFEDHALEIRLELSGVA
jgi:hypothetical protein